MGFYGCLNYVAATAFRMFEFYYCIKELHEEIVCTNPLVCQLFCMTMKNVLKRWRNFLLCTAVTRINEDFFIPCFNDSVKKTWHF